MHSRAQLGAQGEERALQYLLGEGCALVARNYRVRGGEIDLIVRDGDILAFAEVKTRRTQRFGAPMEAVTRRKQQTIIAVAEQFLQQNPHLAQLQPRFDVIECTSGSVRHIRDAFRP